MVALAPHASDGREILRIVHQDVGGSDVFLVLKADDTPVVTGARVPSFSHFAVEGLPDGSLSNELRWYLDSFLEYPLAPSTARGERVLRALEKWGHEAYAALFSDTQLQNIIRSASANLVSLRLEIVGDDVRILGWPWEAINDPRLGPVGTFCDIARICRVSEYRSTSWDRSPRPINILLIVARPYGDADIKYRSVARPIVDLARSGALPVSIELLRPPTLASLRSHLQSHEPGYYQILHFDGHGDLPDQTSTDSKAGGILFETASGEAERVIAKEIGSMLSDAGIQAVVLNACQSAVSNATSEDPFSSFAAGLVQSGVPAVLGMSYALNVSAAQQFLPLFYRKAFEGAEIATAVRFARARMRENPLRTTEYGLFHFQDWLVPILYERVDSCVTLHGTFENRVESKLPQVVRDRPQTLFVGRDRELLDLEKFLQDSRRPAALLQGLAGTGKTELAISFLEWLDVTGGLRETPIWINYSTDSKARNISDCVAEALLAPELATVSPGLRREATVKALRDKPVIVVIDNFLPSTGVLTSSSSTDFNGLLEDLAGGSAKLLIIGHDDGLCHSNCCSSLYVGGLWREDRWELLSAVAHRVSTAINPQDTAILRLVIECAGHPSAMLEVMTLLTKYTAKRLVELLYDSEASQIPELKSNFSALAERLATLDLTFTANPDDLIGLIALHSHVLKTSLYTEMAQAFDAKLSDGDIHSILRQLKLGGLIQPVGEDLFEIHPLLSMYLRFVSKGRTADIVLRAFIDTFASYADDMSKRDLMQQKLTYNLFGDCLYKAREHAQRLEKHTAYFALTQALAVFAERNRNYAEATRLWNNQESYATVLGRQDVVVTAYNHLGRVAEEDHRLDDAAKHYEAARRLNEPLGLSERLAMDYYHLGVVAIRQHKYAAATDVLTQALRIAEGGQYEAVAALVYHHLGRIEELKGNFSDAATMANKALEINSRLESGFEADNHFLLATVSHRQGDFYAAAQHYEQAHIRYLSVNNQPSLAKVYHQLGMLSQARGQPLLADEYYHRSARLKEQLDDVAGAASTYHQLGTLAHTRSDFDLARGWYDRALSAHVNSDNPVHLAKSYHQLGMISQQRRHTVQADLWYSKSLEINNGTDPEGAASTNYQLATVRFERGDLASAEACALTALELAQRVGSSDLATKTYDVLARIAHTRNNLSDAEFWYTKRLETLKGRDDDTTRATVYHQLGMVAEQATHFDKAQKLYSNAFDIFCATHNYDRAGYSAAQLATLYLKQGLFETSGSWITRAISLFRLSGGADNQRRAVEQFVAIYRRAPSDHCANLRKLWDDADLGAFPVEEL